MMFCWKKFHVHFCFPEVSSAGTFENFSQCFAGIFFVFFFVFCCCFLFFCFCFLFFSFCFVFFFCVMWKVVCLQFMMFFLLLLLKFLVGMSSLFRVFIHVFGVNQCGVWRFYRRGSPMWGLKGFFFCVGVTNVGFKVFMKVSG